MTIQYGHDERVRVVEPCAYCGMPLDGSHVTDWCPGDPIVQRQLVEKVRLLELRIKALEALVLVMAAEARRRDDPH